MAYAVIAFFGAGLIVGALSFLPERRATPDADAALVLREDRTRIFGMGVAGAIMGAGCYLLAAEAVRSGEAIMRYVGYFGAAFFELAPVLAIWRLMTLIPIARIDRNGVTTFGTDAALTPWRDVLSVGEAGDARMEELVLLMTGDDYGSQRFFIPVWATRLRFSEVRAHAEKLWTENRSPHST
jgi:hypothetical protein